MDKGEYQRKYRASVETPEQRKARYARNNERRRARRANWSPEERATDLERQRANYQRRKAEGKHLVAQRLQKYGITPADLEELMGKQGGACAICGFPFQVGAGRHLSAHVDHDHATGNVRGLLCRGCNTGLGNFQDNPALLLSAVTYLGE